MYEGRSSYPQEYYRDQSNEKKESKRVLSSEIITPQQVNQQQKVEQKFGKLKYEEMKDEEIESSIEEIRKEIRIFEQTISKKISKHYSELRPMPCETEKKVESTINILQIEKQQRKKIIQFQLNQMQEIQEVQKQYDSRQNIEFAIPISISQTKKGIFELEKFIHIAKIRQKKKSEDLVKVDKTNLQQFEKTAMLRRNLEMVMLYEINLNERQMKCEEHMYEFQTKIDRLNQKLQELGRVVEDRHIPVSSNKNLLGLKEKKNQLTKYRDDQQKKLMLLKHGIQKQAAKIARQKESLKVDTKEKEKRCCDIDRELEVLKGKNGNYLKDKSIESKLRKSISFNYAETLLSMKEKKETNFTSNKSDIYSMDRSILMSKPNFKVKKYSKKKQVLNISQAKNGTSTYEKTQFLLPVTQVKNPEKNSLENLTEKKNINSGRGNKKTGTFVKIEDDFDLISDN